MSDTNGNSNGSGYVNPNGHGRQKGRKVPPLPTYFFESVGIEVSIRRLSPFVMDDLQQKMLRERKPPVPPTVVVEVGDAQVRLSEPNPQDPTFIREQFEYNEWLRKAVGEQMINLMLNYCIVCDPDPDVVEDQRTMLALLDPTLNDQYSDKQVYIRYYLLSSPVELSRVQQFILGQSMPTTEAVQAHIDTFPSDVPEKTPILTPGTPIRVQVQ